MNDEQNREDLFAERIAEPLRGDERADATFEARVVSAVHAAARERARNAASEGRGWWLRPHSISLTPVASLALAAGFAALVLLSASAFRGTKRGASLDMIGARRAVDTVHLVRFVIADPSARSVALVGSFNRWEKTATPLHLSSVDGVWTVTVPLSAGRHEYAFIVTDGTQERWVADPMTESLRDDFGTESSVISVDNDAAS
jgi:hypothetical protein